MTSPFVTVVLTARHDNYGGDVEERIIKPLRFNAERFAEQRVPYEVILVEWDPVPGRPLLSELLNDRLPADVAGPIRRIVVSPEYQRAFTQSPNPFFLEYLAKNVGIRRATTPFVLVSNVDVLLGRGAVKRLADRSLEEGVVYRAPRYDIKLGVDQAGLSWDVLEDPANQVTRAELRPPLYSHGAADFLLGARELFHQVRGFNEIYRIARVGIDANFMAKVRGTGFRIEQIPDPVYHVNHVGSFRMSAAPADGESSGSTWGKVDWHARHVTYNNPDGWGLGMAPSRQDSSGITFLDFDWAVVPPLVELRRVVLSSRQVAAEPF